MKKVCKCTLLDMFNDKLDNDNKTIRISGLVYLPSEVLKNVDPVAYEDEFFNYYNVMRELYYCEELEK
jgi:hypothetical protein